MSLSVLSIFSTRDTHENCLRLKANLPPEERQRQNNNIYYEIRVVAKLNRIAYNYTDI